jgi:hypothetical protein
MTVVAEWSGGTAIENTRATTMPATVVAAHNRQRRRRPAISNLTLGKGCATTDGVTP